MTPENRRRNLQQEWALSQEAWEEGEGLLSLGHFRGAIGRYSYATYHAAVGALLTRELEPKTHAGIRREFHGAFVRTQVVSREDAQALGDLQREREDADYSRAAAFERSDAEGARAAAQRFRDVLALVLRAEGWMD